MSDAPDWRRLVSDAGAKSAIIKHSFSGGCQLSIEGLDAVIVRDSTEWVIAAHPTHGSHYDTPEDAIAAALNHLRAELRARMERDAAALKRLGGGGT